MEELDITSKRSCLDCQSTIDYQQVRQFLKNKYNKQNEKNEILYQQAQEDFHAILDVIIDKFDPVRIYQWGSLLNKNMFKDYSDIDIAVEGIDSAENFFKLYKEIEPLTRFPLDCVQMEKIEPEFRVIIKRKGKIVYERNEK